MRGARRGSKPRMDAAAGGEITTAEYREMVQRDMREDAFQSQVIQLARARGWFVAHFRAARIQRPDGRVRFATPVQADGVGFPDLVLVRDRVVFAELKSHRGKVAAEQQVWIDRLREAGQEMYVWRPRDMDSIEAVLW